MMRGVSLSRGKMTPTLWHLLIMNALPIDEGHASYDCGHFEEVTLQPCYLYHGIETSFLLFHVPILDDIHIVDYWKFFLVHED